MDLLRRCLGIMESEYDIEWEIDDKYLVIQSGAAVLSASIHDDGVDLGSGPLPPAAALVNIFDFAERNAISSNIFNLFGDRNLFGDQGFQSYYNYVREAGMDDHIISRILTSAKRYICYVEHMNRNVYSLPVRDDGTPHGWYLFPYLYSSRYVFRGEMRNGECNFFIDVPGIPAKACSVRLHPDVFVYSGDHVLHRHLKYFRKIEGRISNIYGLD